MGQPATRTAEAVAPERRADVPPPEYRGRVLATKSRLILGGLVLLGVVLVGVLVYPFAGSLLCAAVLAGLFHPSLAGLTKRLGDRRRLAAAILTLAVALVLVLPTVFVAGHLGQQVTNVIRRVESTVRRGGMPALVEELPEPLRRLGGRLVARIPGADEGIGALAETHSGTAAAAGIGLVRAAAQVVLQVALMLVALYFLLLDGAQLVAWLARVMPLPPVYTIEILTNFRSVSMAVVLSSLATAGIQSLTALIGFLIAGVPQPAFFAFVTFLCGFIPFVGASSMVLGLAGWSYLGGHTGTAVFLALWGGLVSVMDNIVKPLLLKGRMEIHGAVILFALFGGLASFGPVGFLAGPLILSFFLAVIRLYAQGPQRPD
jgi:predicted PurR-regulated permease PerM